MKLCILYACDIALVAIQQTCTITCYYILALLSSDSLSVPGLEIKKVANSAVDYQVKRKDYQSDISLITGYQVTRFGVLMIGEYVNAGRGRRVIIGPAVPGVQYRITAWTFGGGTRSATPAVVYATTGEAGEGGILKFKCNKTNYVKIVHSGGHLNSCNSVIKTSWGRG